MKMKRNCILAILLCSLLLSGCSGVTAVFSPSLTQEEAAVCAADLEICLGDLSAELTQSEYEAIYDEFVSLWVLRQARLEQGKTTMGYREEKEFLQFSKTLDAYTDLIYGAADYYYTDEPEYDLVDYAVNSDGSLGEATYFDDWGSFDYSEAELITLWNQAANLLPDGALSIFDTYSVFTDGEYGTVGYIYWDFTGDGMVWGLALDPEDSGDTEYLQETILHEYFHYLSLNESQVEYGGTDDGSTYAEAELDFTSYEDSYLNQFYQAFWPEILEDERLANPDSTSFFLRHYYEFYDDYATTSPSEDIAECFACYVLWEDGWYDAADLEIWEQKIAWFDQFEYFRNFRAAVQEKLATDSDEVIVAA